MPYTETPVVPAKKWAISYEPLGQIIGALQKKKIKNKEDCWAAKDTSKNMLFEKISLPPSYSCGIWFYKKQKWQQEQD